MQAQVWKRTVNSR